MKMVNILFIRSKITSCLCASILLLFHSGLVLAQSISVFGTSQMARDCYIASVNAANSGFTSSSDLDNCNDAIFHGKLTGRDRVATFINRGVIKVALEDFVGGAKDYETAIGLDPEAGEAYLNRGNLWFIARRHNEAITDYAKALELGVGKQQIALLNTGMAYEHLRHYEKAKDFYESALEVFPEWPMALEKLERVTKKLTDVVDPQ